MPTFRRAHQIGQTLRSLLEGRFTDFELLVRDDGDGTDGTADAVSSAANGDQRVLYRRNDLRLGMPGNLNEGIKAARGGLVAVCHDHDLYAADFLSEMVEVLDRHPSAVFVHCAIEVIDQNGREVSNVMWRLAGVSTRTGMDKTIVAHARLPRLRAHGGPARYLSALWTLRPLVWICIRRGDVDAVGATWRCSLCCISTNSGSRTRS